MSGDIIFYSQEAKDAFDKALVEAYPGLKWLKESSNETKEESAEKEAKILNPNIKKVRNKMIHLKPAKKKRK